MTKRREKSTPHGMWAATNRKSEEQQEIKHNKDNTQSSATSDYSASTLPNSSTSYSNARF